MLNPSNALNDPATVSRSDYLQKDGKTERTYQYQTPAQSKGTMPVDRTPENVKHILSALNIKKK